MPLSSNKKEAISIEVIKVLISRFESFPLDASGNRNAPFHTAFLNAFKDKLQDKVPDIPFFISMSSWLHGLNTTLGQNFFENVAHILSDGEKREFTSSKGTLLNVSQTQKKNISDIITNLKNSTNKPDLESENKVIFIDDKSEVLSANGFTADVFIEDDSSITAIELKSVRPNAGEMRGEKQKILEAKASLFQKYPKKKIEYYMGFPFDPTSSTPTGSDKSRFLRSIIDGTKYFHFDEVKLASELWDFLSGDGNTMEQLLDIINRIATTEFIKIYTFLNDHSNRQSEPAQYADYLSRWNLHQEILLFKNDPQILEKIKGKSRLTRIYNQFLLVDGNYNINRYIALNNLLVS